MIVYNDYNTNSTYRNDYQMFTQPEINACLKIRKIREEIINEMKKPVIKHHNTNPHFKSCQNKKRRS